MEAEEQYNIGVDLKAQGQTDAALTAFRRAALANPNHFQAQMEIGALCRERAKLDKIYLRYAFDAFQKAARLDLNHEQAHLYYIMLGQQMGMLDSLMDEYGALAKQFPENQLLQKSHKNIMTLAMAMMPANVNVSSMGASGGIKKLVFISSIIFILVGVGFLIAPSMLLKSGKIKKEQVPGMIKLGFAFEAFGIAGFIFKTRLN